MLIVEVDVSTLKDDPYFYSILGLELGLWENFLYSLKQLYKKIYVGQKVTLQVIYGASHFHLVDSPKSFNIRYRISEKLVRFYHSFDGPSFRDIVPTSCKIGKEVKDLDNELSTEWEKS